MRVETLSLLGTLEGDAGQCRPKCSVGTLDDHHPSAPPVKLVAVVFLVRGNVSAIGVVEEQAVRVVDHPWAGEEVANRNCSPVVGPRIHARTRSSSRTNPLRCSVEQ